MPDGGNWKELLYASERGDLDLMRYHLRMGIDPNYQHPEFLTTPLSRLPETINRKQWSCF